MNRVDRFLQTLRLRQAVRWIPDGSRVLDVGAYDDSLFKMLGPRARSGVVVDPHITPERREGDIEWRAGYFPDVSLDGPFDCICMLAVLEHIPSERHEDVASRCRDLLSPRGRLILTIPSPAVDHIAGVLARLRIIEGMDLDQHFGFRPEDALRTFGAQLELREHKRFELGLNHLLVFERADGGP